MYFFDNPNYENFFKPLCSKNKKIYYECILQLIEKSMQVSLLYENDARDILILYFRNLAYAVEEEDETKISEEKISVNKSESENASAVLRYFRHCGWINEKELGRNGDNIATVMPYCRKIINSIEHIFNSDNSATLTNHIFMIYDILHSAFTVDNGRTIRPYSNILVPIYDGVANLKNELLVLKDSIRSIMRIVIKLTETNELGRFLIRDEMMENFFRDYFFIKKDGLIPGYIEEIEKMLRRLTGTAVYQNMIKEYQNLKNVTEIQAKEEIDCKLSVIRAFINHDYVKDMDNIDKRINNYYSLYSTRILMVLAGNVNLQSYINEVLMHLKNMDKQNKSELLNKISEAYTQRSYKFVGRRSIERRKKRSPNVKSGVIKKSGLSDEERARLTNDLLHEAQDSYDVKKATEYFDKVFGDDYSYQPSSKTVQTRHDAMMVAAGIIYSGTEEFPYEIEFLGGTTETDVATISRIRMRRKKEDV